MEDHRCEARPARRLEDAQCESKAVDGLRVLRRKGGESQGTPDDLERGIEKGWGLVDACAT